MFVSLFVAGALQAATVDTQFQYIHSSDFQQGKAAAAFQLGTDVKLGVEGRYIQQDKAIAEASFLNKSVYSVAVPVQFDLDLVKVNLTPFYYFKNKATAAGKDLNLDDTSAYGINTQFVMNLQTNEVEDLYTQAYFGISYANQKGTLSKSTEADSNQNFSEMAYTLGVRQNFFQAFTFHVAGTFYQYPDGIKDVTGFRGIMDQNDLAFTQSFDYNKQLGKYAISGRITRVWTETGSTLYGAYRYGEFYTAQPEHSYIVGNSFRIAETAKMDIAYNHLQTTSGHNKRDILFVNLGIFF